MRYFKSISDNYIIGVGTGNICTEINEAEYSNLLEVIHNKPSAESGFDYRLREDLEWELYEIPPMPEDDEEATIEDYEAALAELGVR